MSDPPLGRRRFAAAVAALAAGLAGCTDGNQAPDDSDDDAEGEAGDPEIDLSDNGSVDGERTDGREDGDGEDADDGS